MDNTLKYQTIILNLLQEYASVKKTLTPDVKAQVVIDKENQQYQLLSIGWHNHKGAKLNKVSFFILSLH